MCEGYGVPAYLCTCKAGSLQSSTFGGLSSTAPRRHQSIFNRGAKRGLRVYRKNSTPPEPFLEKKGNLTYQAAPHRRNTRQNHQTTSNNRQDLKQRMYRGIGGDRTKTRKKRYSCAAASQSHKKNYDLPTAKRGTPARTSIEQENDPILRRGVSLMRGRRPSAAVLQSASCLFAFLKSPLRDHPPRRTK